MITIYYVEDDLDIAENVKTHLETRQMEVSVFYSIADAKQALLKKRPAPKSVCNGAVRFLHGFHQLLA